MKPTIWITGAGGLIGNYLVQLARKHAPGIQPRGLTRATLELTDFAAVELAFKTEKPAGIIHCAALSRTPECQARPDFARQINVDATRVLAELAADIPFLFFSSDLVFDGERGNYDETSAVNPIMVYAETKVAAEEIVLRNPAHTVIRTSLNAGLSPTRDRAINEQLLLAWRAGKTLRLYHDEFRSPIGAEVTARATWELFKLNRPGVFHIAGSERLSRWEIGRVLLQKHPEYAAQLASGSRKENTGTPRPPDTSLNCAKIQELLSFPLPGFAEWMAANPDF
jgi:dTDP-4-dehydrorhamnose reductase